MKEIRFPEDRSQCLWCAGKVKTPIEVRVAHKRQTIVATVCSQACEQAATSAFQFIRKAIPRFLVGLFLGITLTVGSDFFGWGLRGVATGMLVLGLTVTLWPMVTPQTVEILGMKRAFVAGRVLGFVLMIGAVVFWLRLLRIVG